MAASAILTADMRWTPQNGRGRTGPTAATSPGHFVRRGTTASRRRDTQRYSSCAAPLRCCGKPAPCCPTTRSLVRLVVDTNALLDNPDLTVYAGQLGDRYQVHLLPVVLRELDDHKRFHRREEVREAAKRADRRLKHLRDHGDVRAGVRVAGDVSAVVERVEPRADGLPRWLDLPVPDDRLLGSVLLLQSAHPGSAMFVATGDLNLQTKLSAVRLPFIERPD